MLEVYLLPFTLDEEQDKTLTGPSKGQEMAKADR